MSMLNHNHVRPARAEDKEAIVAFCQNTFSWGDYIANVWDEWQTNSAGQLLVSLVDDQPVGVVHVALLNDGVAWMEGMRVNPAFRRQGIATALDAHAIKVARERGCRLARLATSMKNTVAQTLLGECGYHRTAQFNEWQAEPQLGDFSALRVATPNNVADIVARWQTSEVCAACRAVVPSRHWRWTPIDEQRLREQIAAGEVRVTQNGFALLPAYDESDWNGLVIHALGGNSAELFAIALAVRGEAAYRGYAHVEAMVADYAPLNSAMERAGFKTESGMLLYEQVL